MGCAVAKPKTILAAFEAAEVRKQAALRREAKAAQRAAQRAEDGEAIEVGALFDLHPAAQKIHLICDYLHVRIPLRSDSPCCLPLTDADGQIFPDLDMAATSRILGIPMSGRAIQWRSADGRVGGVVISETDDPEIGQDRVPKRSVVVEEGGENFLEMGGLFFPRQTTKRSSRPGFGYQICQANHRAGIPACLELWGSPAKIHDSQNFVSSVTSVSRAADVLMSALFQLLPSVVPHLDTSVCRVLRTDITGQLQFEVAGVVGQVVDLIKHLRIRGRRAPLPGDPNPKAIALHLCPNTAYVNPFSRQFSGAAYGKKDELLEQKSEFVAALKRAPKDPYLQNAVAVLSDERLLALAEKTLRFEARFYTDGLMRVLEKENFAWDLSLRGLLGIEETFEKDDEKPALTRCLWSYFWRPILEALEGDAQMNLTDIESVKSKLFAALTTRRGDGRIYDARARNAWRAYETISEKGFEQARSRYAPSAWYRCLDSLEEVGISRASLMRCDGTSAGLAAAGVVVSIRQVLACSPMTSLPDWYESPPIPEIGQQIYQLPRVVGADFGDAPEQPQQRDLARFSDLVARGGETAAQAAADLRADWAAACAARQQAAADPVIRRHGSEISVYPQAQIVRDWARAARDAERLARRTDSAWYQTEEVAE